MAIPVWQRLLALLVYLLPWSDAIGFGLPRGVLNGLLPQGGLFMEFPLLRLLILPAEPFLYLENGIPFGGLLLFFVLFLAVVRNPNVPYFLRFNTLQALLVDIALILITYLFIPLSRGLAGVGDGLVMRTLGSTVLLGVLAGVIFALIECLRGREPDLPGISQAVRMQLY